MKFPESWLMAWINPEQSWKDIGELLTMSGVEIEQIETAAPEFTDVVVAEVLEKTKHPDADRLNICRVSVGSGEPLTIVCGAPNVEVGLKVPCAKIGAVLPGNLKIKKSKLRGVESNGMLCSGRELGIPSDIDGLLVLPQDAPVGASLREYLNLDDLILTIKVTPNRADCLSIRGVAREIATLANTPLLSPVSVLPNVTVKGEIKIEEDAKAACPLYYAAVFENINPDAVTPYWMRDRIERCGLRSISPLVDITNYVMLELGQPLHAFDADVLEGDPLVRWGKTDESLTLLDGRVVDCEDILVIADKNKAVGLAGAMGGKDSGISSDTKRVILEAAFFEPSAIAKTARKLSINSDASYRFERGVDYGQTFAALEYACELIKSICGGTLVSLKCGEGELPSRKPVLLHMQKLNRVLGMKFDAETVETILTRLFFSYEKQEDAFLVFPPTYRFDLEIEEDFIEEIARIYGYDEIPLPVPQGAMRMAPIPESLRTLTDIKSALVAHDFHETINFSFIDEEIEKQLLNNKNAIKLMNPIASQFNVMRSSLIGSLVLNVASNLQRKQSRIRLFEVGRVFQKDTQSKSSELSNYPQPIKVAAIAYGEVYPEQWGVPSRIVDFYDIKGDLEILLAATDGIEFRVAKHPAFHPGRCAEVLKDGKSIGVVGELHPEWQQLYKMPHAPVLFEIDYDAIKTRPLPAYKEVSKFQPVSRDLAFIVDDSVKAAQLAEVLDNVKLPMLHHVTLFDVYQGAGVPEGKKSMAYRAVFEDKSATLNDTQIDEALNVLKDAAATLGAVLRS